MADTTARRLAAAVVAGKLAVVALVHVPVTVPLGFAAAAALMLAFTGAILVALRRGVRTPCRCLGSAAQPLGVRAGGAVAATLVIMADDIAALFRPV